jgi:hypothetical protein
MSDRSTCEKVSNVSVSKLFSNLNWPIATDTGSEGIGIFCSVEFEMLNHRDCRLMVNTHVHRLISSH